MYSPAQVRFLHFIVCPPSTVVLHNCSFLHACTQTLNSPVPPLQLLQQMLPVMSRKIECTQLAMVVCTLHTFYTRNNNRLREHISHFDAVRCYWLPSQLQAVALLKPWLLCQQQHTAQWTSHCQCELHSAISCLFLHNVSVSQEETSITWTWPSIRVSAQDNTWVSANLPLITWVLCATLLLATSCRCWLLSRWGHRHGVLYKTNLHRSTSCMFPALLLLFVRTSTCTFSRSLCNSRLSIIIAYYQWQVN